MIIGVDQATVSPNISCTWSAGSKPVLYLIAVSPQNLPSAILSLDATVTLCPERLKQGIFHGDNTIIFWMPDSSGDFSHGVQNIFSKSNYQKHVKVAAFRRVDSKRADTLLSFRYNFFSNELKAKVLQFEASKSMSSTVLRPFDMKVQLNKLNTFVAYRSNMMLTVNFNSFIISNLKKHFFRNFLVESLVF